MVAIRRRSSVLFAGVALVLVGTPLALGATTGSKGPGATSPSSLLAIPVVPCQTTSGGGQPPIAGVPQLLIASTTQSLAKRVNFYSNGIITVLAPKGWGCTSLFAADGGRELAAYPPGQADPNTPNAPTNAQGVIARVEYTAHGPGVELVCGLFPNNQTVKNYFSSPGLSCPPGPPASEIVSRPTPDVALFHDPAGTKGTADLSGGPNAVSGGVLFPQNDPGNVGNLSKETCAIAGRDRDLCSTIIGDFVVRAFPLEEAQSG